MPGTGDHELISEALRGSQRAFRSIVERHHAAACAAVRAVVGDSDEVEDILQEVFLKVYRGLGRFRGDARLSTWIYRVARNEAINHLSRSRPGTVPVESCDLPAPSGDGPERGLERRRFRERLEAALSELDMEERMVIELRYLGSCSYREIAETLEIPLGTVKTRLFRGKAALRRKLRGMFPSIRGGDG